MKKLGALVKLAQDGDGEENRNAAVKALALMKEHEIVFVPKKEIDRVEGVLRDVGRNGKGEATRNLILGALAGAVLGPSILGKKGLL